MSRLAEWDARWQEGDGGERHWVLVEMIHETLNELGWRVVERDVERALRRQLAAWVREVAHRPGSVEVDALLEEARRLLDVKDLVAGACIELIGLVPDALPGEFGE